MANKKLIIVLWVFSTFNYQITQGQHEAEEDVPENEIPPQIIWSAVAKRSMGQSHHWSYIGASGPSSWSKYYPHCEGDLQSPVNINRDNTEIDESLTSFMFTGYDIPLRGVYIVNNGHTIQLASQAEELPTIEGGGLESRYSFLQLHFHWGSNHKRGSEHLIDGQRFPMEMHLIHKNVKQTTESEAVTTVFSVLFQETTEDNPSYNPIVDSLGNVEYKDVTSEVKDPVILSSLLPVDVTHFYRYVGSLTTPPCTEGVVWTVFADPVIISHSQMESFRNIKSTTEVTKGHSKYMFDNFRPLAKLNGRKILESLPEC